MNGINLRSNGDSFEQRYYDRFIANEFPSYEEFWLSFIVPITNRPENIHFKNDQELAALGSGDHELCIAQLHYSVLRHMARVYDIRSLRPLNLNGLTEGMVHLVGAQDVSFELLARYVNPNTYDPWLSRGRRGVQGSLDARRSWQERENFPLQEIRNYRNHLVHGRIMPSLVGEDCYVPRIGEEENYFDWRLVTDNINVSQLIGGDFITSNDVLENAWELTMNYIETNWNNHLL
jgi:hypothetical protein